MKFKSPFEGIHVPDYAKNYQAFLDGSRKFHNPHQQIEETGPVTDEYRTRRLEFASEELNRAGGMRMGGRGRRAGMTYAKGAYRGLNKEQAFQKAADQFDEKQRKFEAPYGDHTTRRHSWVPDPKHHAPDPNADWKTVADMKNGVVERGPNNTRFADGSHLQKGKDGSKFMVTPYGTISSDAPKAAPENTAQKSTPTPLPVSSVPSAQTPRLHPPTLPASDVLTRQPRAVIPQANINSAAKPQNAAALKFEAQKKAKLEKTSERNDSSASGRQPPPTVQSTGPIDRIFGMDPAGLERDSAALENQEREVDEISANLDRIAMNSGLNHLTQANFNSAAKPHSAAALKFEAPREISTEEQTLNTAKRNISQVGDNVSKGLHQAGQHPAVQKVKGAYNEVATSIGGTVDAVKSKVLSNPTMRGIADNIQGTGSMRFEAPTPRPIFQGKHKTSGQHLAEGVQKLKKKWNANPTVQGIRNTWNGTGPMRFEAPKTLRPKSS